MKYRENLHISARKCIARIALNTIIVMLACAALSIIAYYAAQFVARYDIVTLHPRHSMTEYEYLTVGVRG